MSNIQEQVGAGEQPTPEPVLAEAPKEAALPAPETANTVAVQTEEGPVARGYAFRNPSESIKFEGVVYTPENLTHRIALKILEFAPNNFARHLGRGMYAFTDPYWEGALSKPDQNIEDALQRVGTVVIPSGAAALPCANCPK